MYVNIYNKEKKKNMDYKLISSDFETHADDITISNYLNNKDTSRINIWLACTLDDYHDNDWNEADIFDYNIQDWVNRMFKLVETENVMCYFYNSAFDVTYFIREMWDKANQKGYTLSYCGKSSFSTVWSVTLKTSDHELIIKDMKLLLGAGSLASNAKAMGLKHQKLSFSDDDYKKDRYLNPVSDKDKEYCYYDVAVLLEMIEYQLKLPTAKDFFESVSAASYAATLMIKETFPEGYEKRDKDVFHTNRSVISRSHKAGSLMKVTSMKKYRDLYPGLGDDSDTLARKSYHGGICHPFYKYGKATTGGLILHLDFASLYPSVCALQTHWPQGKSKTFKGLKAPDSKYFDFYHIRWWYSGKANMICDIPHQCLDNKWAVKTDDDIFESYICDFELETYKKCYPNFEYEVLETERYNQTRYNPFKDYMTNHFKLKQHYGSIGNKALKAIEKMLLNSPTGKLGEKDHDYEYQLKLNEDNELMPCKIDKDKVSTGRFTYVPLISAITAYGRQWLVKMAEIAGFENCIYCDTDSLFIYTKSFEDGLKLLNKYSKHGVLHNNLGGFELENVGTCFTTPCAKKYTWFCRDFDYSIRNYKTDSKWEYNETISGVNELTGIIDVLDCDEDQITTHSRLTPKGRLLIDEYIKFNPSSIEYSPDKYIRGSKIISPEDVKMLKQKDKPAIKTEKDKENFNLKYKRLEKCCDK